MVLAFFSEILDFWGAGNKLKRERSALLAPGGVKLQRPWREHWIVGSWCFLRLTDSWSAVRAKFWHSRYLSVFIGCRKQALCGYFPTRLTLNIAIQLQHPAKALGFETNPLVCAAKRSGRAGRRSELRDEFERALHAGSVMEKTLLEPSQVESHQPHLGSAVGLRHGESRTLSKCFWDRRHEPPRRLWRRSKFWGETVATRFAQAPLTFPADCGQSSSWAASRSRPRTCN